MVNTAAPYTIMGTTQTVPSGADLSAGRYLAVKLDASGRAVLAAAATDRAVGVLMNNPNAADMEAVFGSFGTYPMKAGGSFNEGDRLVSDSNGKVVASTTAGDWTIGIALGASTGENQIVPVRVGPFGNI